MSEATDTAKPAEEIEEIDGQLSLADAAAAGPADADTVESDADADAVEAGSAADADEAGPDEADEAGTQGKAAKNGLVKAGTEAGTDADIDADAEIDAEAGDGADEADGEETAPAKAAGKRKKAAKPAQKPARASAGPGVPGWVLGVLGALVVALAVSTAWLWTDTKGTLTEDEINKAVRTAAASAQHISSWDYRTIEQDIDQVLGETTGDFHQAYEASAAKLLQTAPEQEAVTVGLTSKAGVESVKGDGSVTVLVFLNQQTTSKDAEAHIEQHRLRLTMVEKDGDWLVSKLEVLG